MENKIILEATAQLQDKELRFWFNKLVTKIETLNDRTKNHTLQIKALEKELRKIKQNG